MKRILYLVLMLPLLCFITSSCDDDKDLPQVSLSISYEGGVEKDGTVYVVKGEPLNVTSLKAIPAEGTKAATLGAVTYFWDGIPQGRTIVAPYAITINTEELATGTHSLGVNATVLQVDKEVGFAVTEFPVVIVENQSDLPGDANGGTITPDTRVSDNEK